MNYAQDFHEKNKSEGECVIDVWTFPAQFDITFENEDPDVDYPMITIKQRQWSKVMFYDDPKLNIKALKTNFLS
jgi:hypothetical protein